jgi:hypothetical protein
MLLNYPDRMASTSNRLPNIEEDGGYSIFSLQNDFARNEVDGTPLIDMTHLGQRDITTDVPANSDFTNSIAFHGWYDSSGSYQAAGGNPSMLKLVIREGTTSYILLKKYYEDHRKLKRTLPHLMEERDSLYYKQGQGGEGDDPKFLRNILTNQAWCFETWIKPGDQSSGDNFGSSYGHHGTTAGTVLHYPYPEADTTNYATGMDFRMYNGSNTSENVLSYDGLRTLLPDIGGYYNMQTAMNSTVGYLGLSPDDAWAHHCITYQIVWVPNVDKRILKKSGASPNNAAFGSWFYVTRYFINGVLVSYNAEDMVYADTASNGTAHTGTTIYQNQTNPELDGTIRTGEDGSKGFIFYIGANGQYANGTQGGTSAPLGPHSLWDDKSKGFVGTGIKLRYPFIGKIAGMRMTLGGIPRYAQWGNTKQYALREYSQPNGVALEEGIKYWYPGYDAHGTAATARHATRWAHKTEVFDPPKNLNPIYPQSQAVSNAVTAFRTRQELNPNPRTNPSNGSSYSRTVADIRLPLVEQNSVCILALQNKMDYNEVDHDPVIDMTYGSGSKDVTTDVPPNTDFTNSIQFSGGWTTAHPSMTMLKANIREGTASYERAKKFYEARFKFPDRGLTVLGAASEAKDIGYTVEGWLKFQEQDFFGITQRQGYNFQFLSTKHYNTTSTATASGIRLSPPNLHTGAGADYPGGYLHTWAHPFPGLDSERSAWSYGSTAHPGEIPYDEWFHFALTYELAIVARKGSQWPTNITHQTKGGTVSGMQFELIKIKRYYLNGTLYWQKIEDVGQGSDSKHKYPEPQFTTPGAYAPPIGTPLRWEDMFIGGRGGRREGKYGGDEFMRFYIGAMLGGGINGLEGIFDDQGLGWQNGTAKTLQASSGGSDGGYSYYVNNPFCGKIAGIRYTLGTPLYGRHADNKHLMPFYKNNTSSASTVVKATTQNWTPGATSSTITTPNYVSDSGGTHGT